MKRLDLPQRFAVRHAASRPRSQPGSAVSGFVAEIPEKSGGRERWWRALPFHFQAPDPAKMTSAEWSAAIAHTRAKAEHDIDLYFRVLTQYEGPDGWAC